MSSIKRDLTVKGSHRDADWAREDVILEALTTVVDEIDIDAIQLAQRNIIITFNNKEAKIAAVTFGLHINNTFVTLSDVESNIVNITLRDIPVEIPNSVISAHLSRYVEHVEDISYGFVKKADGSRSTVKTGVRYITVSGIKLPIPNNPTIGGFPGRLSYRGQPCGHCSGTDHPYYRCPNKENRPGRGCYRCGALTHQVKDCTNAWGNQTEKKSTESPQTTEKSLLEQIRFDELSPMVNRNEKQNPTAAKDSEIDEHSSTYNTIVLGASLANAMAKDFIDAGFEVRAKSGKRIEEIKDLLKSKPIEKEDIEKVVIQAGANNICYYNDTPEESAQKYDNLVKEIHENLPKAEISVCSLTPIHPCDNAVNNKIRKMNKLLKCMCEKHSEFTCFIDSTDVLLCNNGKTSESDYTTSDPKGVHLSNKGYRKLSTFIKTKVLKTEKTPKKRKDRGSGGNTPSSTEKLPKTGKFQ
ncbi:unnamed protein product [Owenia fusiformis]|uniref:Uncharacterized protein n=1 Tax=Owenia fusiformis TaxID=6347 RepID=A0A8J1UT25_OWEFU|nr:unnamed protein product [Owenia fusiformis]